LKLKPQDYSLGNKFGATQAKIVLKSIDSIMANQQLFTGINSDFAITMYFVTFKCNL